MPSRVRIKLYKNGRTFYGKAAYENLLNIAAIAKAPLVKLPNEVGWQHMVQIFRGLNKYRATYDPGMRLFVTRERRGQRLAQPIEQVKRKKTTTPRYTRPLRGLEPEEAPVWRVPAIPAAALDFGQAVAGLNELYANPRFVGNDPLDMQVGQGNQVGINWREI